jgi:hypothetical protein
MAREMFQFNLINDLPPVDCVHDLKTGGNISGGPGIGQIRTFRLDCDLEFDRA